MAVPREEIEFLGVVYYRYPKSRNWSLRNYFGWPRGARRRRFLHRAVWEHSFGKIPRGHHIHHKDKCALNNSIDNLECLSRESHMKLHQKEKEDNCHLKV